uniref:Uncharacterized protein n=1 Tax=Euplotes vanleeuwenhoeki TaxID=2794224 RepID=A0A7T1C561_9SPIT|nr:hypothetical protein KQ443_mgp09 [Euplotes vanleeuwenhoeki]QPM99269.1 hypothetical protein MitoLV_42 [Euplotes vanleeuwenhoeki]
MLQFFFQTTLDIFEKCQSYLLSQLDKYYWHSLVLYSPILLFIFILNFFF